MEKGLLRREHPGLLAAMLVLGTAPLLGNAYAWPVQLVYFILMAVTLLYYWRKAGREGQFLVPGRRLFAVLLLYILTATLTLFWTVDINNTLMGLLQLYFYLFLFYLVSATFQREQMEKLVGIVLFSGISVAALGILSYLLLKNQRVHSTFINPNALGIYLAMVVLLALSLYLHRPRKSRLLCGGIVLLGICLMLTFSRGSLLALVFSLPLVLAGIPAGRSRREALARLVLVGLTVIAGTKLVMETAPYLQQTQWAPDLLASLVRSRSFLPSSVAGRWSFWVVAAKMIADRPWGGFGLGNYHRVYFNYYNYDRFYSRYAHNHYLQTAAETGIPSLLLFLLFLLLFYRLIYQKRTYVREPRYFYGMTAAATAFLLHIGIDFSWDMPAVTMLFWALLGLLVAQLREAGAIFSTYRSTRSGRWIALAVLLFFLAGTVQQAAGEWAVSRGHRALREGEKREALRWYSVAAAINPWNARYHSYRALTLVSGEEGKPAERAQAVAWLRRAVSLSPYNDYYHLRLGQLLWQQGELEEARRYLSRATFLGGFKPEPYVALGNFYLSRGNLPAAEEVFRRGLQLADFALVNAPDELKRIELQKAVADLHLGLARVYDLRRDYARAARELKEVLQVFPGQPVALKVLEEYRKTGKI